MKHRLSVTPPTLKSIADACGVDLGHLHHVWSGQRQGRYELYVALRAADRPLCPDARTFEKAAKKTFNKESK